MVTKSESLDKASTPSSNEEWKEKFIELSDAFQKLSLKMDEMQKTAPVQKKLTEDIRANEFIKVMSLLGNKLNLSTQPHGRGKTFSFDRFGEIKSILYSDLVEINNNQKNFMEAGYYYILDDRVVEIEGLGEVYARILNKKQIEDIISNRETAIALFQKANPKQQSVITNFICEKILSGEQVDYNLVNEIDRISIKLDEKYVKINERVEKSLEVRDIMEKPQ
jgi:hypothetical protein